MRLFLIIPEKAKETANTLAGMKLNGGVKTFGNVKLSKNGGVPETHYGASLNLPILEIFPEIEKMMQGVGGVVYKKGQEIVAPDENGEGGEYINSFEDALDQENLVRIVEISE